MNDTIIGALIALGSIGFAQALQYMISTKKEKRNLKLQNIKNFKEIILKLRVHVAELYVGVSEKQQKINSLDLLIELHKLCGDLYTLPETKQLAEKVEDLIEDYNEYRMLVGTKKANKAITSLKNKLQELQKISL